MKIQSLIEAKFSKPQYAYHATAIENLRSIIKNGLIPNFREDGYGSEEQSSVGYSLTPLKGVYLTRKARDAIEISKVLESPSGMGAVIICKIQPQQAELDEDRLTSSIIGERHFAMTVKNKLKDSSEEDLNDENSFHNMGKKAHDFIDYYIKIYVVKEIQKHGLDDKAINHIKPFIHEYLFHLLGYILDTEYGGPEHEDDLKKAQNDLTRQLRHLAKKDPEGNHTFKLDAKIGFSGANRIVGIYFPMDKLGWGDLGALESYAYHKYGTPVELFNKAIVKYIGK